MNLVTGNRVCQQLGCTYPVVLAGMGGVSRAELVGAVTEAGGFGFLGMVREPARVIESEVEQLRDQGHPNFGVNIIPAATDAAMLASQIDACVALGVPSVGLFWDIDRAVVKRLRDAGILVIYQVGSPQEAKDAVEAGAQIIIAQGREAGGHVRSNHRLAHLLPSVSAAVDVPVLAAGGITAGADLIVALALGAQGVVLGTAFLATKQSFAHDFHKQKLLASDGHHTVLTDSFHINWPPHAPTRVLASAVTQGLHGDPWSGERTVIGDDDGRPIYLFSTDSPLRSTAGVLSDMALYAGTGVGRIESIGDAGERLTTLINEAEALLVRERATPPAIVEMASSVCYVDEFDGAYMGLLSGDELLSRLGEAYDFALTTLRLALNETPEAGNDGAAPFASAATDYAQWSLAIREMILDLGGTVERAPLPPGNDSSLPLAAAGPALVQRLQAIVDRTSSEPVRSRLAALAKAATPAIRPS